METEAWLDELDLAQYAILFRENDLDREALPYLEDADLRELGITSLGHRKKLLRAIAALKAPAASKVGAETPTAAPPVDTELRQVSVMFCDLVGSTALSTRLDAEEMDAVIRRYQEVVTPIVHKFGGHVARFSGDGILSYFGYPSAIEHEAELALRAALEASQRVAAAEFHPGVQSQVRIGIATGDVVVGGLYDRGRHYEAMVTGQTPNLAARLQGVAEPGAVVICENTKALAGGLFTFIDNGLRSLRGFDKDVSTWVVGGHSGTEDRFSATRDLNTREEMAGRNAEIASLLTGWRRTQNGMGTSIVIQGEAGVGKSRLFNAFCRSLEEDEALQVRMYCTQYSRSSPLFPVVNFLNNTIGSNPEFVSSMRARKLRDYLEGWHPEPESVYPYLCRLLDITDESAEQALSGISPQRIRETIMEVGIGMLSHGSVDTPILIFVEDIHWADPTTQQFLERFASGIGALHVMLVMTARPDTVLDWPVAPLMRLELQKLDDTQLLSIVQHLTRDHPLPEAVLQQVVEKSDGIPLFAEEITKSLLAQYTTVSESLLSGGSIDELSVPSALQSGLMMRLDRLGDVRDFVLECAVIGREFSLDLAAAIAGLSQQAAAQVMEQLVEMGIIEELPQYQPPRFSFSHALLRDAAYGNLLRSRRREIHLSIAEILQSQFPHAVANEPERLAHHYTGGENYNRAIDFWLAAGQRALAASANQESADHLQRGLEQLQHVDDPALQIGLELQLQMTLAPALIQLKGFAAGEVKDIFSRARELCELIGTSELLFPVIRGLMAFYTVGADYDSAIALGQELGEVISDQSDTGHQLEYAWVLGSAYLFSGDIDRAMNLFEQGRTLYDPEQHREHALIYGQDPGVATLTHYAVGLSLQGRYSEGAALEQQILDGLDALNHPFTRAQAMGFLQSSSYVRGERERVFELASQNLAFCQEQCFPVFMAMAMVYEGWSLALGGDESGTSMIRDGIGIYELSGALSSKPSFLAVLAAAYMCENRVEEAVAALDEADEAILSTGELLFRPGIAQLRAEIVMQNDDKAALEQAAADLRAAIIQAREAGVRHYELVCQTSLVKLLLQLGTEQGEEVDCLAGIYRDMQEESGFAPLQDAREALVLAGCVM